MLTESSLLSPQQFSSRTPTSCKSRHSAQLNSAHLTKLNGEQQPPHRHPHPPIELDEPPPSERERQQQDVIAGLRTQVAALTSLLEHGVRVPLMEQPSLGTSAALQVWFGPMADGTAAHAWQWKGEQVGGICSH